MVYYELLKSSETITGDRYRTQSMRLCQALEEKQPQYQERHGKVILQHDNARPDMSQDRSRYILGNAEMGGYSPDVASSDYHFFLSMAHGLHCKKLILMEDVIFRQVCKITSISVGHKMTLVKRCKIASSVV